METELLLVIINVQVINKNHQEIKSELKFPYSRKLNEVFVIKQVLIKPKWVINYH
jgi:hypothetical protein